VPGGKPTTADPGVRSKSPRTRVGPVFVTVDAPRIEALKRKRGVPGIVGVKPTGGIGGGVVQAVSTAVVIVGALT
jgi:hypothetical protein